MNNEYLLRARQNVPDAKTLVVLASKRAAMLAQGALPMVKYKDETPWLDVALLEIAEGKLVPNFDENAPDDFLAQIAAAKAAAVAAGESNGKQ